MKLRFRVGRTEGRKDGRKNGDIEALADAMRALKKNLEYVFFVQKWIPTQAGTRLRRTDYTQVLAYYVKCTFKQNYSAMLGLSCL